jgi:cytochrome P450
MSSSTFSIVSGAEVSRSTALPLPRYQRSRIANYWQIRSDPIGLFAGAFQACGDVVRIGVAHEDFLVTRSAAVIRQVLADASPDFVRKRGSTRVLRDFIGDGVITTNGAEWQLHRKAMGAALGSETHRLAALILGHASRLVDRWSSSFDTMVQVAFETMAVSYRVTCEAFFGHEPGDAESEVFAREFMAAQAGVFHNWTNGSPLLKYLPTKRNRAMRRGYATFLAAVEAAKQQLRDPDNHLPLAQALQGVRRSGCPMHALFDRASGKRNAEDSFVRGFLATSPENPSNIVSWAMYLLAQHPEVLARLRAESDAAAANGELTNDERLPYMKMVLAETMRLYPGGWIVDRTAIRDTVVDGYLVPKGTHVLMPIYHLHRNAAYFENPERFDPERFRDAPSGCANRFAYIPFGSGPHQCIGMRLAQMETRLILSEIVRRIDFCVHPSESGEMHPMFTLRPCNGMRMIVRRRA